MTSGEEESDDGGGTKTGANAYWARIREEQEAEDRVPTFTGAFRGTRPTPHGGTATVRPQDTLGTEDWCWCGQPLGHSWPGKTVGAKHPKNGAGDMTVTTSTVDRRDLRAYHRRLQDFVLQCVNVDMLRYRLNKNGIILYPPDGTTPMTVSARNTDRQIRQLQKWYLEHVYQEPVEDEKPDEDTLRRLAEATNDPVEHPPVEPKHPEYQDEPAKPEEYLPPQETYDLPPETAGVTAKTAEEAIKKAASTSEWKPLIKNDGEPSEHFITNGMTYICTTCRDAGDEFITDNVRATGGHIRTVHTDRGMWTPEARAKAHDTARLNRLRQTQTVQALELLIEATGYQVDAKQSAEQQAVIADLQAKLSESQQRVVEAELATAEVQSKYDELSAKLALIREATGL